MIEQSPLNLIEKRLFLFGGFALLFAFYFNLGVYPLLLEEPRRALIALEMLFNDNIWVPTQTGELYYRKPPVYNWLLIGSFKLFGEANELAIRFFSVASHLLSGLMVYVFTKRYINIRVAVFTFFGFLLSADILTYFSTLGEIDLFYALVTSLSIFLIFYYGEKEAYGKLFLSVYFLTSIGFLTKGLTSVPFTAISLLVFFIQKKEFKRFLGIQHMLGILLFTSIIFGYFYQYNKYEDVSGWWSTLISESADKATGGGFNAFIGQIVTFPFEIIKILLPATLFIPLFFIKGTRSKLKQNEFVWFCLLIFIFNFPLYWFSIEARSRYIYPLFPFAVVVLTYLAMSISHEGLLRFLKVIAYFCLSVMLIVLPASLFIDSVRPVNGLVFYIIPLMLILGVLAYLFYQKRIRAYVVILLVFIVVKLTMSSIVPEIRAKTSGAASDKKIAAEIAEMTKGERVNRLNDLRISLGIVFYLEREKKDILRSADKLTEGFYFVKPENMEDSNISFDIKKEFLYRQDKIWLISIDKPKP